MATTLQLTMNQTKKTSHSYNQDHLKIVCDSLCDKIESLFEILSLDEIQHNGKMYVGCCPIHNGDNKSAFNIYPDGESYRGNWKCRTHNCEKYFKASIIGFIRGVLSNKKYNWEKNTDKSVSFQETMEFIEKFLGNDIKNIKISKSQKEKNRFTCAINHIVEKKEDNVCFVDRHSIRKSLLIPSQYFIDRGFSSKILERYDVGLCNRHDKEMYNRAVAPIYDIDHKYMVGCTGRSIFNKCSACESYHDPNTECPSEQNRWKFPKWKHNYQFKSQNHLYNIWFAKKSILETNSVILVESPGNVWRLEECGINNSVALFGANLSDRQRILLDGSGAMTIITIMDNDEAGQKAAQAIKDKCKNTYNIININISKPDIAEMTDKEIQEEIKVNL